MSSAAWEFTGFSKPNTTQVPDQLFDELLHVLSGNELKVVMYVARRTFGFKKDSDNISLSQMLNGIVKQTGERLDHGVGLSKPTLLKVLRSLTEKKVLIATRRSSRAKGDMATNYQLHFAGVPRTDSPPNPSANGTGGGGKETDHPLVKNLNHGGVKDLYQAVVKPFDHTTNSRQQTVDNTHTSVCDDSQEEDVQAAAKRVVVHFHRVAEHPRSRRPTRKEIAECAPLVVEHGEEKLTELVTFAVEEAQKTDFSVQHFQGLLAACIPAAIENYDGRRRARELLAEQGRREREDEQEAARIRAEWQSLSPTEKVDRRLRRKVQIFPALNKGRKPTAEDIDRMRVQLATEEGLQPSPGH